MGEKILKTKLDILKVELNNLKEVECMNLI